MFYDTIIYPLIYYSFVISSSNLPKFYTSFRFININSSSKKMFSQISIISACLWIKNNLCLIKVVRWVTVNQNPVQASDSQSVIALNISRYLLSAQTRPGVKEICKRDPQDIFLLNKKAKLKGNWIYFEFLYGTSV